MRGTLMTAAAALAGVGLVLSCGGPDGGGIPTFGDPVPAATPGPVAVAPAAVAPGGNSWTDNGLKVTIIGDEWGPGSCHTNGGTRTLLIENVGDVERYSNLAAFTDDKPVCATSKTPTGKPSKTGPDTVKPGEAVTVSYSVTLPNGKGGVCTLQADDCWGPGGIQGCAFVIGDAFKVADSKCAKVCEEPDIWKEKPGSRKTVEGTWGACPEQPTAATVEEVCYECRTNSSSWIETNCDAERPRLELTPEKREKACECVETGPVTTCGDWNKCHEHPAANDDFSGIFSALTNSCAQEKVCVDDYVCKPDREYEMAQSCECVCVDDPKGTVLQNSSGNPFTASATFEDAGSWRLRIHASSRESECLANAPDYWKRTVLGSTKCDERGSLSTSYSWAGHGTEWWRAVLELDGSIVDEGPCVRNPFN